MYYKAKCRSEHQTVRKEGGAECVTAKKEDDPDGALNDFRAIVDQEEEKGDW
jgi:uncharacterized protein YbaA (DUF1428 family)